jgi:hypothetical protein
LRSQSTTKYRALTGQGLSRRKPGLGFNGDGMENIMSTSAALALIIATFLPGFLVFYLAKLAVDTGAQIVTGVVWGVPVSIKYRRLLLYQTWANYVIGAAGAALLAAAVSLKIARDVADAEVQLLAYFAAFIGALLGAGILLSGVPEFLAFRSVLRETKRD